MDDTKESEILDTIQRDLSAEAPKPRPGSMIICLARHEHWRGAPQMLDHLVACRHGGLQLFLMDRPVGRLNSPTDNEYLGERETFRKIYLEPRAGDLERFKEECLWRIEQTDQSRDELIKYWKDKQTYPPGKVPPENYALFTFEEAMFFGVVDPRTRTIIRRRAQVLGDLAFSVHEVQNLHMRMAFRNTLAAMASEQAEQAVAIVLQPWLEYYQSEAKAQQIELEVFDCEAHALPFHLGHYDAGPMIRSLAPKASIPWTGDRELLTDIANRWNEETARHQGNYTVRLLGLLFARPESQLAKSQVVPHADWLNERSGGSFDLFWAGYELMDDGDTSNLSVVTTVDRKRWVFSTKKFNEVLTWLEAKTKYKYSGGVDLVLLDAVLDNEPFSRPKLDFNSVIVCQLDTMVDEKMIRSVEMFLQDIMNYAQRPSQDGVWGLSDHLGVAHGGSATKRIVLSLLPKNVGTELAHVASLAVKDIGRNSQSSVTSTTTDDSDT